MQNNYELQWQETSDKMQQLMERLPEMERLSALCQRLDNAAEITAKAAELQKLTAEHDHNRAESMKYREAGNEGLASFIESQMGYLVGPIRSAEKELNALLLQYRFDSADDAASLLAANASRESLRTAVDNFSREYAEILSRLNELDAVLSAQEE